MSERCLGCSLKRATMDTVQHDYGDDCIAVPTAEEVSAAGQRQAHRRIMNWGVTSSDSRDMRIIARADEELVPARTSKHSHISSNEIEIDGVKARVIMERNEPSEKFVKVTLEVTPPNPGLDRYPYSVHVIKPESR